MESWLNASLTNAYNNYLTLALLSKKVCTLWEASFRISLNQAWEEM